MLQHGKQENVTTSSPECIALSYRMHSLVSDLSHDTEVLTAHKTMSALRILVKDGGDVNFVDEDKNVTLLAKAIDRGQVPIIGLLKELGADITKEIYGKSPLTYCLLKQPTAVLPLLQMGFGDHMSLQEKKELLASAKDSNGILPDDLQLISDMLDSETKDISAGHVLYDLAHVKAEMEREKNSARKHFLHQLIQKGAYKTYTGCPDKTCIDPIYDRFPNFIEVLDFVRKEIILASLSDESVFTITPILLKGDAGIGKTRFVNELAKALSTEFTYINCAAVTANFVLSGSSTSWQDGRPGKVFTSLQDGKTGNPILMLDEIDKMSSDSRFDAYGPLYQLLEQDTAKSFSDEAVQVGIDCSRVIWVATANSDNPIPQPIISRFKEFVVPEPTPEQMPNIIRSIYADILDKHMTSWGQFLSPEIDDEVMDFLVDFTPREIKLMTREAIGEAASNYAASLAADEAPVKGAIRLKNGDYTPKTKRRMGF